MKKQELIHLHGLLAEVHGHYEKATGTELEHDEYEALGVRPTSIHKSKTEHKNAVFKLAKGITESMETAEQDHVAPKAD